MNILKNNLFRSPSYIFVWMMIIGCLGMASWIGMQVPVAISELYSSYGDADSFNRYWELLAILFVGEYVNRIFYQLTMSKFLQHILQNIRKDCYSFWVRSYTSSKTGKEKTYTMGEILARIMSDTESIKELLTSGSFTIIIDLFFVISCFIGFIKLNKFIGISFIGIEILVCIFLIWGSKFMAKVYMSVRVSLADSARVLTNLVEGFPQSYHTPHHNYAIKRGDHIFEDFLQKQLKANVWDASYYAITESLFPIFLVVLVIIVPFSNLVELALIAALIDLLQRSISPIKQVAGKISNFQRAMTGVTRLHDFQSVLASRPSREVGEVYPISQLLSYSLKVEKFHYGHDDREFEINNFSLIGAPGDKIGLIGKSGSGKSTILKIITAELEPQIFSLNFKGEQQSFEFSSHDKTKIPAYRQQISLISQDSHIFSDTVNFNICLGEKLDGIEAFWAKVQVELPYLRHWGIGLDDTIDPKLLSLGQKQLLSALRSCYLSRPIVLLDEISSALDSGLEQSLRILTKAIQEDSLLIVVAHRVETIIDAKQIIVMDKGQVIASGKHADLEKSSEVYQDFVSHLGRI